MNNTTTLKNSTIKKTVPKTIINNTKTVKKQKTILPDPQIWRNGVNIGDYTSITAAVNAAQNGDTIILQPGTYQESNIPINTDLTIIGENQTTTIIDAQGNGNIFTITSGITVNLEYITFTNGYTVNGGAIINYGTLTITNCTFTGNTAANYGGAIYNEGTLTETNTTFNNNIGSWGGAIYNYNEGITNNINCTFNNNNANNGGSITNKGNLTETNSTYTGNNADEGGAIYNFNTLTETNSIFNQNYSNQDDGIILNGGGKSDTPVNITGCTFTNNNGEAIVNGGYLNVTNSTFTNNIAEDGGAIYNSWTLTVTDSTFNGNNAIDGTEGGAIDNEGTLTDIDNTYDSNTASDCGGAIYNDVGCTLTESNSTFNSNTATNNGGAIYNNGYLTINDSTLTNNNANNGGAVYNDYNGISTIEYNRIIANNNIDIYNNGNTIDATLNWWGTNFPGTNPLTTERVTNNVNANPWIILTITANPTIILTGDTSTITADLLHDSNNNPINPLNGLIPYTDLVSFTSTLGTINNASMTNGIATTTLNTSNNPGTTDVTATIDDATVTTNVDIKQNPRTAVVMAVYNNLWYYLDLEQEYEDTYVVGNTPVFMWSVQNSNSHDEATGVVVNYIIPKGFKFESADSGGQGPITYAYNSTSQQGVLTWDIGYMPKGGWVTTYVTLMVMEVGDYTDDLTTTANLVHVDQTNVNPSLNQNVTCSIDSPSSADVQVNQTYTSNTQSGKNYVTYTITATNNGPSNATGVQITDLLPSGVKYVSDTSGGLYNHSTGLWNIGNLNNGAIDTFTITAQITAATGTIINTADKTNQNEYDQNQNNNGQSTYVTISGTYTPAVVMAVYNNLWYYLDLEQEYEDTYVVGNTPVFMWSVQNSNSHDEATGVVVNYIIPKGFKFESADSGGQGPITYAYNSTSQQGVLTWDIGYMPKGGWVTTYVTLMVMEVGDYTDDLTTTANLVHVDQTNVNPSLNQNVTCSIDSPSSADVQVNQTYTSNTQSGKNYVTYTITATNNGPSNATGVQITDLLPSGEKYVSDTSGGLYNHSTGLWNIGNLNNGAIDTFTITAQITAATGTIINTADETNQNEYDQNQNNNGQSTYLTTT